MNAAERIIDRDVAFYNTCHDAEVLALQHCPPSSEQRRAHKELTAAAASALLALMRYRNAIDKHCANHPTKDKP